MLESKSSFRSNEFDSFRLIYKMKGSISRLDSYYFSVQNLFHIRIASFWSIPRNTSFERLFSTFIFIWVTAHWWEDLKLINMFSQISKERTHQIISSSSWRYSITVPQNGISELSTFSLSFTYKINTILCLHSLIFNSGAYWSHEILIKGLLIWALFS